MPWFWKHGNEFLTLFLTPLFGLAFDLFIKKKIVVWLLVASVLLSLPICFNYSYILPYAFQILGLIWGGSAYSFLSSKN